MDLLEKEKDPSRRFTLFPCDPECISEDLEEQDYFLILPQEIIICIFEFLSIPELRTCAEVSKYWLMISCSPELWSKIKLISIEIEISFLERILNCKVKDISASEIKVNDTADRPRFKTPRFDSLQRVAVFYSKIDLGIFEELISLSPNLKAVELSDCTCNRISVTFFREIVKLQFLEKLYLCNANIITIAEIVKLFKNVKKFRNLKYLHFFLGIPSNENPRLSVELAVLLENLLELCPNLEDLFLREQNINDKAFRYILKMKNLKNLDIRMNALYSKAGLSILPNTEKLFNLEKLYIDHTDLPPRMQAILLYLSPNLNILGIGGVITKSIFEQIVDVEDLVELKFCDADLSVLNSLKDAKKFNELRVLHLIYLFERQNLTGSYLTFNLLSRCNNLIEVKTLGIYIDDGIFTQLLDMRNLEKLELLDVKMPVALKCSENYRKFEKLKSLELGFVEPIPDPTITEFIILCCENLTHLDLSYHDITEKMWRCILSMSELESLDLCGLEADKSDDVSDLIRNSQKFLKLKELSVRYINCEYNPGRLEALLPLCNNVCTLYLAYISLTDDICRSIASMSELRHLSLSYVAGISDKKITDIMKRCPKLKKRKIRILSLPDEDIDDHNNTSTVTSNDLAVG